MKKYLIFIIAAVILAAGGCGILKENVGESVAEEAALSQFEEIKSGEEIAVLTTDLGVIKIRFFESDAPLAVADFKGLAREGYYDGTKISRITEYYIQTGAAGDGKEDRSIYKNNQGDTVPFKDEFSKSAPHLYGAVSMVNSGVKDSNLSQFFIVVSDSLGESVAENSTAACAAPISMVSWAMPPAPGRKPPSVTPKPSHCGASTCTKFPPPMRSARSCLCMRQPTM